ncbi:MAG: YebC/PmpR family DNA-binding transcriptional regulator [Gammaproteobacteria bacterium]|nr:YebC/PmpR family DNA-binding transcriptional regulator [Gammaproteobacteria bacterium]MDH3535563.1 YebC/PmpR family DNA-binding transcriptional regulator [Gammaproteobacteria bacterium]
MAGHSKWANIQHRKKAQDARRGKLFTRLIREIVVAAKSGGSDLDANPALRTAVDKAKSQSVPKDAIDRAVKRGAGELDGSDYEEIRYEGYGPAGVAFIVDCLSDNRNRTVAEVRHAFTKAGGNLGQSGSVAYLFANVGILLYSPEHDEDSVMEAALEAGAEDVVVADDGSIEVLTAAEDYASVKQAMTDAGLEPEESDLTMRASTNTELDLDTAQKVLRLVDLLENSDDVQEVYYNAEIPEQAYEAEA